MTAPNVVAEVNGVPFYDDHTALSVEAMAAAVRSCARTMILIAGGGAAPDEEAAVAGLAPLAVDKVSTVILLGGDLAAMIRRDWEDVMYIDVASMEEAVRTGYAMAEKGEPVVLSPGCAAGNPFRDAAQRGDEFRDAVRRLADEIASGRAGGGGQ